jgi:serine/threonine protein kinase
MMDMVHEIHLWAKLSVNQSCAQVVQLLGVTPDFPPAVVMEFCPLGDLSMFLYGKKKAQINMNETMEGRIALDISLALSYLHSQNPPVMHRDVRGPNVLLVSLDDKAAVVAKLADFGLATTLSGGKICQALVKKKKQKQFVVIFILFSFFKAYFSMDGSRSLGGTIIRRCWYEILSAFCLGVFSHSCFVVSVFSGYV